MNKDCLVRDYWNNGSHIEWVRTVANGSNAYHPAILQNYFSAIILNYSKDVWVWSIDLPPSRLKVLVATSILVFILKLNLKQDGTSSFQKRLISSYGGLFVIASLQDGI